MQEKTPDQIQQEGNKYVVFSETMKLARPMKFEISLKLLACRKTFRS